MHWPPLWCKTGVLSDREIKKLFGEKIFIWPFEEENLKGATYNLTASCIAKCAETGKILVNKDNDIVIKPGVTALIETNESIYVDRNICGTYHSKVKLVSEGLTHISTTLDPCYFGPSLIAISNISSSKKKIKVGDTFVSLMLIKIPRASNLKNDNIPSRTDIISFDFKESDFDSDMTGEAKKKLLADIDVWKKENWRIGKDYLIREVKKYKYDKSKKHGKYIAEIFCTKIVPIIIFLFFMIYLLHDVMGKDDLSPYVAALGAVIVAFSIKFGELLFSIVKIFFDEDD